MRKFCSHATCFVTLACNPPFHATVQAMPLFKCNPCCRPAQFTVCVCEDVDGSPAIQGFAIKQAVSLPSDVKPCLHCSAVAQSSVLLLLLQISSEDYVYNNDSQAGCIFTKLSRNQNLCHSTALLLRAVLCCCRSAQRTMYTTMTVKQAAFSRNFLEIKIFVTAQRCCSEPCSAVADQLSGLYVRRWQDGAVQPVAWLLGCCWS